MAKSPKSEATTQEHRPPAVDSARAAPPGLLMAFPSTAYLPVPKIGEPVGRAWLAAAGHADPEVSGEHACFVRSGSQLALIDEGSRNGTFVDGERLGDHESVTLVDGSIVRIGRTLLVYRDAVLKTEPAAPLGRLVGPWGLGPVWKALGSLRTSGARNVVIEGETGTGKELVAEAVAVALRRRQRYGVVNMAAVSSGVFEAQLFGWRRGAYSGAGEGGPGVFVAHDGGAVFLDELGDLPLELQPKLLRLLEAREVQPVGSPKPTSVDVAIVAATHRDLDDMVEDGRFRRDLLARFDRRIQLPALRDRVEDIFAVLCALATARRSPIDLRRSEVEAVERLMLHDWRANVRELAGVLQDLEPPGVLTLAAVERALGRASRGAGPTSARPIPLTKDVIARALAAAEGNQVAAARALGVTRGKLLRAMKKLG